MLGRSSEETEVDYNVQTIQPYGKDIKVYQQSHFKGDYLMLLNKFEIIRSWRIKQNCT